MMLFIYDFDFNLLLAEPDIIKSRWVAYYNDVGTFEAHLPITSEVTRIVSENPYLVVKQHGLSAIIVGKELGEELVLYGRTCNWLLTKRITPDMAFGTALAGEKAAELAKEAFSDVENFEVGNVISGSSVNFEKEECQTLDAVRDCLALSGLGHEVVFNENSKQWEFNVLSGIENDLILSEAHKNAYDTGVATDILDFATCGRYDKKTDSGYVSTEITGDPQKTGIYRWEAKLSGSTETEAKQSLDKCCEKNKISMSVNDIFWGTDYALGDIVRLQIIKGAYRTTEKRRLYGVEISVDRGVYKEQPIFE